MDNSLGKYNGDIIKIEKLIEFLPTKHWEWDDTGELIWMI